MDITLDVLMDAFARYNQAIFPLQIFGFLLSFVALYYAFRKTRTSDWVIIGILIYFYIWNAFAFWLPAALDGFTPAYVFIAIFVFEAGYLLYAGIEKTLSFHYQHTTYGIVGLVLVVFGLVIYPLIGLLIGRQYPEWIFSPMFPCPMNIWAMGMLLLTDKPLPRCLVMVPFLWGIMGFLWVTAGLSEDIILVFANITGAVVLWSRDLRYEKEREKKKHMLEEADTAG